MNQQVKKEGEVCLDVLLMKPIGKIGLVILQDNVVILLGIHVFASNILRERMYTRLPYIHTLMDPHYTRLMLFNYVLISKPKLVFILLSI